MIRGNELWGESEEGKIIYPKGERQKRCGCATGQRRLEERERKGAIVCDTLEHTLTPTFSPSLPLLTPSQDSVMLRR